MLVRTRAIHLSCTLRVPYVYSRTARRYPSRTRGGHIPPMSLVVVLAVSIQTQLDAADHQVVTNDPVDEMNTALHCHGSCGPESFAQVKIRRTLLHGLVAVGHGCDGAIVEGGQTTHQGELRRIGPLAVSQTEHASGPIAGRHKKSPGSKAPLVEGEFQGPVEVAEVQPVALIAQALYNQLCIHGP